MYCMVALMTSCDNDIVSIATKEVPDNGWAEKYDLSFDLSSIEGGQLYIRIEHAESYGYENIYLKSTILSDTDTLSSDVYSIPLMTDKGQWVGSTSNDLLSVDHLYPFQPLPSGATSIQIQQYSRAFLLKDIEKVSLLVKKQ